jgi:hypothetical protein
MATIALLNYLTASSFVSIAEPSGNGIGFFNQMQTYTATQLYSANSEHAVLNQVGRIIKP